MTDLWPAIALVVTSVTVPSFTYIVSRWDADRKRGDAKIERLEERMSRMDVKHATIDTVIVKMAEDITEIKDMLRSYRGGE